MKNYCDLNQCKVLMEFLPLESADMCWCNYSIKGVNYTDEFSAHLYAVKEMKDTFDTALNGWDKYWELIPCWSLAALLNVLPYPQSSKDKIGINKEGWMVSVYPDNCRYDSCWHDNLVDACVEMILKLHELKFL